MLQGIRDRAHGWIAWVIVILIIIPFALWGVQEYLGNDPDAPVVVVGKEEVSLSRYQRAYYRQQSAVRQAFGGQIPDGLFDEGVIRDQALNGLIREELLLGVGRTHDLSVSDDQLLLAIQSDPSFSEDGLFSRDRYELFLSRSGYSPGAFEFSLRRSLLTGQLITAVSEGVIATKADAQRLAALETQSRTFTVLTVEPDESSVDEPDDAAVQSYFEQNMAQFRQPERIQISYIMLSRDDLARATSIEQSDIEQAYEARLDSFGVPEQRRASHILVTVGDDRDESEAQARIAEISTRLNNGDTFEALAEEYSDDPGSGRKGGDLGFFGKGVMDSAFENMAFAIEKEVVSEPVRTAFGFHLIKVTDIRESTVKPLEEVAAEIELDLQRQAAEQEYFGRAEQLANLSFEQPDTLEPAAETLGLEIKTTEFFARQEPLPVLELDFPRVREAAFSQEVLEQGNNSEIIELDGGKAVVLRIADRTSAEDQQLEDVRDAVVEALKAQSARRIARERGVAVLAALRGGQDFEAIEDADGLSWSEPTEAARQSAEVEPDLLKALFRMRRPGTEGKPVYDAVFSADGVFTVLRLDAVTSGGPLDLEDAQVQNSVRQYARGLGRDTLQAYVEQLRSAGDVRIFEERLTSQY